MRMPVGSPIGLPIGIWLGILVSTSAGISAGPAFAARWDPAGADSLNVTVFSSYQVDSARGVWACAAFVDDLGREYGILCADSLHIVSLADPYHPRAATVIPPAPVDPPSQYVHAEVRWPYAYAAVRHGPILIIDLTDPEAAFVAGEIPASEFCSCSCGHPCSDPSVAQIETLEIDDRGVLFVAGIQCGEGMHMYDLAADPVDPPWLCHEHTRPPEGGTFYAHDAHVRGDLLVVTRSRVAGEIPSRWDLFARDPLCPQNPGPCGDGQTPHRIASITHDGPENHAHSAFTSEDGDYLFTTDEKEDGHIRVWDIHDVENPVQVAEMHPDATCHSVHHVYVRGTIAYAAWYNKGIQVFDVSDPAQPERVGWYEHPLRWHAQSGEPCCDPTANQCYGVPHMAFLPSGLFVATEGGEDGLLVGRFPDQPVSADDSDQDGTDRDGTDQNGTGRDGTDGDRTASELRVLGRPGSLPVRLLWEGGAWGAGPTGSGLAMPGPVQVFDAAGRPVAHLEPEPGATDSRAVYRWDGRRDDGQVCGAGAYFARPVDARGADASAKIILID